MSEFLGNIYDRSVAIVFETVYFSTFWRLWKLFFSQKTFQNLVLIFSFYQKNGRTGSRKTSMTQAWLVTEICSALHWVTFLIFCQLMYDMPSHFKGLILA